MKFSGLSCPVTVRMNLMNIMFSERRVEIFGAILSSDRGTILYSSRTESS
jgi:hypothetical protein